MQHFTLFFNKETLRFQKEEISNTAKLHTYLHKNYARLGKSLWQREKRPAMILCPGGSYYHLSQKESEPTALPFLSAGYQVFILEYTVGFECRFPLPLLELAAALLLLRENAKAWQIDENQIATLGFSAGGNLVGMLGNTWQVPWLSERLQCTPEQIKPNAQILSYALYSEEGYPPHLQGALQKMVQTLYPQGLENLPWEEQKEAYRLCNKQLPEKLGFLFYETPAEMNLQKNFHPLTPPTFLWHTREDVIVPAVQALSAAHRLACLGVPYELHLFDGGKHGLARADKEAFFYDTLPTRPKEWISLALSWLSDQFSKEDAHNDKK